MANSKTTYRARRDEARDLLLAVIAKLAGPEPAGVATNWGHAGDMGRVLEGARDLAALVGLDPADPVTPCDDAAIAVADALDGMPNGSTLQLRVHGLDDGQAVELLALAIAVGAGERADVEAFDPEPNPRHTPGHAPVLGPVIDPRTGRIR